MTPPSENPFLILAEGGTFDISINGDNCISMSAFVAVRTALADDAGVLLRPSDAGEGNYDICFSARDADDEWRIPHVPERYAHAFFRTVDKLAARYPITVLSSDPSALALPSKGAADAHSHETNRKGAFEFARLHLKSLARCGFVFEADANFEIDARTTQEEIETWVQQRRREGTPDGEVAHLRGWVNKVVTLSGEARRYAEIARHELEQGNIDEPRTNEAFAQMTRAAQRERQTHANRRATQTTRVTGALSEALRSFDVERLEAESAPMQVAHFDAITGLDLFNALSAEEAEWVEIGKEPGVWTRTKTPDGESTEDVFFLNRSALRRKLKEAGHTPGNDDQGVIGAVLKSVAAIHEVATGPRGEPINRQLQGGRPRRRKHQRAP